ncbi:MAG TPA: carbonic anhydrase, partial [Pirellulaceae bacterium]
EVLRVPNIIICGHSQCGAIQAVLSQVGADRLPAVKAWCGHAEATRRIVHEQYQGLPAAELAVVTTEQNVLVQMANLGTHPSVAARVASGTLQVFGWYYDIGQGQVWQFDQSQRRFVELGTEALAAQTLPIRCTERLV